ncbi:hypothetical protein BJ508DRAFT_333849 [Ascobolus immersus RN42]|uniref:Uncharacterized protein n=1 Tax=Ascobolus immersus RN42 TaxID=1160509 RepID=A0A3N4HIE2_ASCIM|nr:hypothetical protein BJ508DRAFT_333849 [Ascobolus immersus RN42]
MPPNRKQPTSSQLSWESRIRRLRTRQANHLIKNNTLCERLKAFYEEFEHDHPGSGAGIMTTRMPHPPDFGATPLNSATILSAETEFAKLEQEFDDTRMKLIMLEIVHDDIKEKGLEACVAEGKKMVEDSGQTVEKADAEMIREGGPYIEWLLNSMRTGTN